MSEIWETVGPIITGIVSSEWFGVLVVAPLTTWLLDRLLDSRRDFKRALVRMMLEIEKNTPDWAGVEKRKQVVDSIILSNKYARMLPRATLEAMVDAVIEEIKQAQTEEELTIDEGKKSKTLEG